MRRLVLVAHDIRSAHNVGSLLRTAEGLGIDKVYLTGYSPYPAKKDDSRLPHVVSKLARQIHKTALGAERSVKWDYAPDIKSLIAELKAAGFTVAALEQTPAAADLRTYAAQNDIALIVGNEVDGIPEDILRISDEAIAIPMAGRKESFNVAVAAAIALYHLQLS